jgi:hypothetical protein
MKFLLSSHLTSRTLLYMKPIHNRIRRINKTRLSLRLLQSRQTIHYTPSMKLLVHIIPTLSLVDDNFSHIILPGGRDIQEANQ